MDQIEPFADDRLIAGCLYCGGYAETREHVPSKVFLDAPRPTNLPVVGACHPCNNGFSADEEYVAWLIEAAVAGTTDPAKMRRATVAKILRRSPKLRARLAASREEVDGKAWFMPEMDRVSNVVVKLARGHAAYELSLPCREEPFFVSIRPLASLTDQEVYAFKAPNFPDIWPEVGSRAMMRMMVVEPTISGPQGAEAKLPGFAMQDWQDVQDGRYSYLATEDGGELRVRILIADYLACDVRWQ